MPILDSDDSVSGRVVPFTTSGTHAPSRRIKTMTPRGRELNTIACERIARLRADELLALRDFNGALPWLRYANEHMTRNNVIRMRTVRR